MKKTHDKQSMHTQFIMEYAEYICCIFYIVYYGA